MRPLALTLEGLRSFRSPVTIDFTGRDHVAIIGDTGAGKSSLLEGMTWALYGRTSWSGQPNQELVNDTSPGGRVVLRFRVRGQTWQVTRALRRRGDGTIGPAKVALAHLDDDDLPVERVEGVAAVRNRVEELLGLDDKAFTRTVVLPQGQFAQLLLGEGDVPRADILRQVWRLDELEAAARAAARAADELAPTRARLAQALEGAPDDPVRHLAELRVFADRLSAEEEATADVVAAVDGAAGQLRRARETIQLVDRIGEHLVYDPGADRAQAAAIAAEAHRLARARRDLVEERTDFAGKLVGIPADDDGLTAVQVATAQATVRRLPALVERALVAAEASRHAQRDAGTAGEHADDLAARAQRAQEAAGKERDARVPLAAALTQATQRLAGGQRLLHAARTQAEAAADLASKVAGRQNAAAQVGRDLDRARPEAAQADKEVQNTAAALAAAQRENAAAAAADGLHAGDACPVCDRALPGDWEPPHAHALVDARAAAARAAATARAAAGNVTHLETLLAQTTEQARALADEAAAAREALARAVQHLCEALAAPRVDLDQPDDAVLERPSAAVAAADAALEAHDERVRAAQERAAALGRDAAAAGATAAAKRQNGQAALRAAADALDEAREALACMPPGVDAGVDLAPDAANLRDVPLGGLDAAAQALDVRERALAERANRRAELRSRIDAVDGSLKALDAARERDVTAAAHRLCSAVERHAAALTGAAARLDVADLQLPPLTGVDPSSLPDLVEQVADRSERLQAAAADRREAAVAACSQASRQLAEQAALLGVGDDAGPDALRDSAARRHADATFAAKTARNDTEAFSRRVEPLARTRAAAAALEARAVAVGDLVAALKDGAFPKWVTLRRSRALLAHASRQLGEMTADRYSFADLDDENDDWRIVDNDTGMPRSPASLSGGEKFVASLALAFGMVEMMARSGGRLESLWLDEGFGALDRSNLDAAVEALSTLASGGRLVAVISHIRAVAEQVLDVLAVTRTPTGSTARWLTGPERAQVAEADTTDGDQARGALAGLLE